MKNTLKFIIFLIYTIALFWIKDIKLLSIIFIFQIIMMILCHISLKKTIKIMLNLMPFILFTAIINVWSMGMEYGIQIAIKLILVCHITYIYGSKTTAMQIANAIENLLYPLKLFKINTKNITLMISIAITFIPIIKQEINNIQYSLTSKGMRMNAINKIKHINYVMDPLFYSLIRKVKEIEESLKAKAYIEE